MAPALRDEAPAHVLQECRVWKDPKHNAVFLAKTEKQKINKFLGAAAFPGRADSRSDSRPQPLIPSPWPGSSPAPLALVMQIRLRNASEL